MKMIRWALAAISLLSVSCQTQQTHRSDITGTDLRVALAGCVDQPGFYACGQIEPLTIKALVMMAGGIDQSVEHPLGIAWIYTEPPKRISSDMTEQWKILVRRNKWNVPLRELGVDVDFHEGKFVVVKIQ